MPNHYRIVKASIKLLKAPLIQPFRIATGEHRTLQNILVAIELGDGTKGFGEAAIATHITGETFPDTLNKLKIIARALKGCDITEILKFSAEMNDALPNNKSAVAAVETALLDALTRQLQIPLWRFFGAKPQKLQTDITIVLSSLKETTAAAKLFYKRGFRIFKVKVGDNFDLDYQRVLAVKKAAPRCPIYLDMNQGFSAEETLRMIRKLQKANVNLALIEQPVPKDDWEGLTKVSRLSKVPVCADESVSSVSDGIKLIRQKAAPVINIKLMKFGLFHAREMALLAKTAGVKLMIGAMLESPLAILTSAHLAAGLGGFDYIDLDTTYFLKGKMSQARGLNTKGVFDLKTIKAGVGIVPKSTS